MIEFSLIAGLLLFLTMGAIDFSLAFFQWNAATKAVQLGARLAAVSDPVCVEVKNWTGQEGGDEPGFYPPPAFEWVYDGTTDAPPADCSIGGGAVDPAAVAILLDGRCSPICGIPALGKSNTFPGMRKLFQQIGITLDPQNIVVRYTSSGLGYSGRPGVCETGTDNNCGAVPTITVEVTGVTFNFMLLNGVLGLDSIPIPGLSATVTGEDLSRAGG